MSGIVIQNLAFAFTQKKLIVSRADRKDLPYLTISWNNRSGEFDIHLTPRFPKDNDDRESIIKIHETILKQEIEKDLLEIIRASFLRVMWNVHPGWLAKNHYYLIGSKKQFIEHWLIQAAPKLRGKYRFDLNAFKKLPGNRLYSPTARRLIELGHQDSIIAVCQKGRGKGQALLLFKWRWPDESLVWIALNFQDVQEFGKIVTRHISRFLRGIASPKVKRVYEALKLKEIGL